MLFTKSFSLATRRRMDCAACAKSGETFPYGRAFLRRIARDAPNMNENSEESTERTLYHRGRRVVRGIAHTIAFYALTAALHAQMPIPGDGQSQAPAQSH